MPGIHASPLYAGDAAAGVVALADDDLLGSLSAVWKFGGDGFTYRNGAKGYTWINPLTGMDQFEILVDLAVGSDGLEQSAGLGVWLTPGTYPAWGYSGSGAAQEGTLDVQIRRASDGVVVDTATITLTTQGTTSSGGVPSYPPTGGSIGEQGDIF